MGLDQKTIVVKNRVLAGDKPVKTIVLGNRTVKTITLWQFQNDIILDHLSKNRHTLTESPTGSGKSSIMLSYAALSSEKGKKTVIITPMLGINHNFRKYVAHSRFCAKGSNREYVVPHGGIVEEPKKHKTKALKQFLSGPDNSIYVATYRAFKMALDTGANVSDVVLLVDEVHHSDVEKDASHLGSILRTCNKKCSEVHCFTATDFRTDGGCPVPKDFHKYRRTLAQHYSEGFCPDFGVFARFYHSVNKVDFEKMANGKNIGDPKALLEAYVDEYEKNPLPTMMYVDNAKQANALQRMLLVKLPNLKILNLGSDDGIALVSDNGKLCKIKFTHLSDMPLDIDAVISIKLCNEGVDWAECAQTFSPRVTSSLQLFMQRCIGRTLRRKRKLHVSPFYSRVVIFEISLNDHDRDEVTKAFLPMAIVLKAICEGLDFTDTFILELPGKHRHRFESERTRLRTKSNVSINTEILQKLLYKATTGASAAELIILCHDLYASKGIELSGDVVTGLLMQTGVIDKADVIDLKEAIRLRDKNLEIRSFAGFVAEYAEEIAKLRVIGVSDFVGILSGRNDLDVIARMLVDYTRNSADHNKEQLFILAKNGADRPSNKHINNPDSEERRLATALVNYTCVHSNTYDHEFDIKIHAMAPSWFEDKLAKKKHEIIDLARSGGERPLQNSDDTHIRALASVLSKFTNSTHRGSIFDKKVRRLAPQWFINTALENKKKLLSMAKRGIRRPTNNNNWHSTDEEKRLWAKFCRYIDPKANTYDRDFTEKVRFLAPHWFVDSAEENRKELLRLAYSGAERPSTGSDDANMRRLAVVMNNYCRINQDFMHEIRLAAPAWFINTAIEKKDRLLEMARNGEKRPTTNHKHRNALAVALGSYTNPKNKIYDPDFDHKIRTLAPRWFVKTIEETGKKLIDRAKSGLNKPSMRNQEEKSMAMLMHKHIPWIDKELRVIAPQWFVNYAPDKRKKIIKIARDGGDRPCQNTPLGMALSSYINKNNRGYNLEFHNELKKLRPDWFDSRSINVARKKKRELLQIAKNKSEQPRKTSHDRKMRTLAIWFCRFSNSEGPYYDQAFCDEINKLAPSWFGAVINRKSELLSLAKTDSRRPLSHTSLGRSLYHYTDPQHRCYDIGFDRQIHELRPDWFIYRKNGDRYAGPNKYRDFLLEVLNYYKFTKFTTDHEFWTLGGSEWHEYRYLVKTGISFKPTSYHNVDREELKELLDISVCHHPNTEFSDIHRLWNKPAVISYDSTVALVQSNTGIWQELCHLGISAAKKSGNALIVWNFMVGYANKMYNTIDTDLYDNWIQIMEDLAEHSGISVDFYKDGQITQRKKSHTPMLAGCCKLTLVQAAQKTA